MSLTVPLIGYPESSVLLILILPVRMLEIRVKRCNNAQPEFAQPKAADIPSGFRKVRNRAITSTPKVWSRFPGVCVSAMSTGIVYLPTFPVANDLKFAFQEGPSQNSAEALLSYQVSLTVAPRKGALD